MGHHLGRLGTLSGRECCYRNMEWPFFRGVLVLWHETPQRTTWRDGEKGGNLFAEPVAHGHVQQHRFDSVATPHVEQPPIWQTIKERVDYERFGAEDRPRWRVDDDPEQYRPSHHQQRRRYRSRRQHLSWLPRRWFRVRPQPPQWGVTNQLGEINHGTNGYET